MPRPTSSANRRSLRMRTRRRGGLGLRLRVRPERDDGGAVPGAVGLAGGRIGCAFAIAHTVGGDPPRAFHARKACRCRVIGTGDQPREEASIGPDGRSRLGGGQSEPQRGRDAPGRRARGAPRRGPAAARQARPRPDGQRPASRPHGGAAEAARVPGRRPHRRADRRRLHRARRRPERPLGHAAGAVGRGDRRARAHVRGSGGQGPAHRRAARAAPQQRVARHAGRGPVPARARPHRRPAARARRLLQALGRQRADLAARAAVPGPAGLRLGRRARPTSSSAAPTRPSTC